MQEEREINMFCFPVLDRFTGFQHIDTPDHFIHGSESKLCHNLAQFFGNKEKEIDDMIRGSFKFRTQTTDLVLRYQPGMY